MTEKYSWRGINKDIHPEAMLPDGTRALKPGTMLECRNGRVIADSAGAFQAIVPLKGTTTLTTSALPSGTNTVIASVEDKENNRLILLVANSLSSHTICRINLSDNSFAVLATSSTFGFTGRITSVNIVEGNLTWAQDGLEQRHVDLNDIPSTISVKNTSLYKAAGTDQLNAFGGNDATILVNKMAGNAFQFAYRFVYSNDAYSMLSPFTNYKWTNAKPDVYDTSPNNYMTVKVECPATLRDVVKRLEYFARVNGNPEWYFIGSIDNPTDEASNAITFTNNYLGYQLSDNELRPSELIPKSSCQAVFRDRIFTTMKSEGLDVDDGNWSATVTREFLAQRSGLQFKGSGVYSLSIKFEDDYGRKTLVRKIGDLAPYIIVAESGSYTDVNDNFYYAKVVISGTPPSWAKRWSFCLSKNKFHGTWCQFPGNILFYQYDESSLPEGASIGASSVASKGYVYSKSRPGSYGGLIHIQMPKNLPFVPEVGMYVRILSGGLHTRKPEKIRAVLGDRIVVGNFSEGTDTLNWSSVNGHQLFEVYTIQEETGDDVFYETEVYDISEGFAGTHYPQGDTHIVTSDNETLFRYEDLEIDGSTGGYDYSDFDYNSTMITASKSFRIESKTPLFALGTQTIANEVVPGSGEGNFWYVQTEGPKVYTLDYSKIVNNFGRPYIEQKDNPITTEPTTIIFSDPFVQDSNINGLHHFTADNLYPLPNDLTPIVKLQPVGDSVLLAIHQREVTSLLIGEGYIKSGQDNIISKTVGVVGDDRSLLGGYGTIHPTSVASVDGYCFFFDINRKAVVRYANNGLFPVSDYGMRSYFITKSEQYFGQSAFIYGWVDRFMEEYMIHFPAISGVAAETWGFNYRNNVWTCRHDLTVDHAATALDTFFSCAGNAIYKHNATTAYNVIQGGNKEFTLKFYANPEVTKTKRFLNLDLHSEGFMSGTSDYKVIEIFSPHGQETYLKAPMLIEEEYTRYAQVLKDINSTNVAAGKLALRHGKEMRDKYFEVHIKTDVTGSLWKLYGLTAVMTESNFSR